MNVNELLDWLHAHVELEPDLEARREYGLMIGYAAKGLMDRQTCETARDSHFSRARAWQHVLAVMDTPPVEAREAEEATP